MKLGILKKEETERQSSEPERIWITSRFFYLFFLYTVFIWSCEALDLIGWLAGFEQAGLLSRITALMIAGIVHLRVRRKASFYGWDGRGAEQENKKEKDWISRLEQWLFFGSCLLIASFCLVKCIFPDFSYDTGNYHLYVQNPGFVDNIHYNVLPGRFQLFGFRLPDRMFYLFRSLLGLRLGMMFTAAALITACAQTCALLNRFRRLAGIGTEGEGKKGAAVSRLLTCTPVLALLFLLKNEVLMQMGSYMVEILALPYFLELLFLLTDEEESRGQAVWFCLLGGIFFAMKMTNIVYLLPVLLLYIIKIRKTVTVKLVFTCLAAGCLPVAVYLIYNGVNTGNIVYPYYNELFQSPWFPDATFKDTRWGPSSAKEILLWPFYVMMYPDYRMSELPTWYVLDLAAGYLAMILLTVQGFRKGWRNYWREGLLLIVYVISVYAWAATTGHTRYFMLGSILNALLFGCWYIRMAAQANPVCRIAPAALLCLFAGQVLSSGQAVLHGEEWGFRSVDHPEKKTHISWFFKDRELADQSVKYQIDMIYLTQNNWGGWAGMIADGKPIVNLQAVQFELENRPEFYDRVHSWMEQKRVWDMFLEGEEALHTYLDNLNQLGYYVEDLIYLDNSLVGYRTMAMARLTQAGDRKNQLITAGREENEVILKRPADRCTAEALAGSPVYTGEGRSFTLQLIAEDASGNKRTASLPMEGKQYQKISVPIDLTGMDEEVTLRVSTLPETVVEAVLNLKLLPAEQPETAAESGEESIQKIMK